VELSSIIGNIYDASSNDDNWLSVGKALFNYLGAEAGSLRLLAGGGRSVNVFETRAESDHYADHYLRIDSIRSALCSLTQTADGEGKVFLDEELTDSSHYRRSEFFHNFVKPDGQDHMIVGIVGDHDRSIVGFYRQGVAFGVRERATLSTLLPHVRRALQLRQRLHRSNLDPKVGYAAFDALPGAAILVDADCNVLFANSSATETLCRRDRPIAMVKTPVSGTKLHIDNRGEASRLRALIRQAACGGAGGAIRLEFDGLDTGDRIGQYAVFVKPQVQAHSIDDLTEQGRVPVLIVISELSSLNAAKPSLFSELFGLSAAEGAVAAALLGGKSAETVARDRDVSLDTVRAQIRTVLRKSNAANLRDFERIGALLGSLGR
jgi:DNA-binding NarL/FixJ family response regulator